MNKIPFTLPGGIIGHLNPMDKSEPSRWFHVMVNDYYKGQLMLNPGIGWWLPDSSLEQFAGRLGEIVQAWYQ